MFFLLPVMFHVVITMALDGMMTNAKIPINTNQWPSIGTNVAVQRSVRFPSMVRKYSE
jgi:hypothetical protein